MFVCAWKFFLCMLLNKKNKKNEFNLYAQISKGHIKIMLYFPWKCRTCIYKQSGKVITDLSKPQNWTKSLFLISHQVHEA